MGHGCLEGMDVLIVGALSLWFGTWFGSTSSGTIVVGCNQLNGSAGKNSFVSLDDYQFTRFQCAYDLYSPFGSDTDIDWDGPGLSSGLV